MSAHELGVNRAMIIDAEFIRSILDYSPETGAFTWRARPRDHFKTERSCNTWNTRYSRSVAGSPGSSGYLLIGINCRLYPSHRLAWLWMTGEWPSEEIDHIDGDRLNNCFTNLRQATHSENQRNRGKRADNTSGAKGVFWSSREKKWRADIMNNGARIYLGCFDKLEDAAAAYANAARKFHGEFARVA